MSFNREQLTIAESIKSLLDLLPLVTNLEKQIIDKPRDISFLADTAFLCRKSEEILQAVRKSLNTLSEKAEEQACYVFEVMQERKYSNENVTISPNPTPYVKFPTNPDDPAFPDFVKKLPIIAIRPHYPTVIDLICTESENGGALPFGLKAKDIAAINLKLRVTGKRDL